MRVDLHEPAIRALLNDPAGPVGRQLATLAQRVTQDAKRRCPTRTGRLRSSISWDLTPHPLAADIGTDVEYSWFVEYGTKPHVIRSHGDYPLRDKKGNVFGREVDHPGTRAQPFLRPSLDAIRGGG
jgi:Bacteriophage HK97-gp10, putative tail-component